MTKCDDDDTDDYGHTMKKGQKHVGVKQWIRQNISSQQNVHFSLRRALCIIESTKKGFMFTDGELFQETQYVEHSDFIALLKA